MEDRRALNRGGATYVGARAVAIPADLGVSRERSTRRTVVRQDLETFTLDDGETYEKVSGVLWHRRYSSDAGTLRVPQAYTEGSAMFEELWRSATTPTAPTPEQAGPEWEQAVTEALRRTRRIPPWARPDFYYDLGRARAALEALPEGHAEVPMDRMWEVLARYRRTEEEIRGLTRPVGPRCLTAGHGVCELCRSVRVWAYVAEHRWARHGGAEVRYDVEAITTELERIDRQFTRIPHDVVAEVIDARCRPVGGTTA